MAGYIVALWASENNAGNTKNRSLRPGRKEHGRAISITLRNKPLGHQSDQATLNLCKVSTKALARKNGKEIA